MVLESGGYGSQHDAGVLASSILGKLLSNARTTFPTPELLPGSSIRAPFVVIADKGYGLQDNLLKPYVGNETTLSAEQRRFNYKLSSTRRVVEQAFGQLCAQFSVFRKPIDLAEQFADLTILASGVLHNIFIDIENRNTLPDHYEWKVHPTADDSQITYSTTRNAFTQYFRSFDIYKEF